MKVLFSLEEKGPYSSRGPSMIVEFDELATFKALRKHFSEEMDGAFFLRKNGVMDTTNYAISPLGRCRVGMYWEIKRYFKDEGIVIDIEVSEDLRKLLIRDDRVTYNEKVKLSLEPRDYQLSAIKNAIKLGRGTLKLATGAGKTLMSAYIIENYFTSLGSSSDWKCIFIVPDLGLVTQTYNEFKEYGVSFTMCKWTGKNKLDGSANVIICNSAIIQSRVDVNKWVYDIDMLVVDEVHKVKDKSKLGKIIDKISTQRKYSMTGTLPTKNIDKWAVFGRFGPIVYEKESVDLRNENYLTHATVHMIHINYAHEWFAQWQNELDFIYENQFRNKLISKICSNTEKNILIMVNHILHGEILLKCLSGDLDKDVFFVQGSMDVSERDRIKNIMEVRDNVVCIAISSIFSTGINIKNLPLIVFAAGGKSPVRIIQSIGRGLRLHENKDRLNIIDISDNLKYGTKHSIERNSIYKNECIEVKTVFVDEKKGA